MEIGTEISRKIRVREKQPGRSLSTRGKGLTPLVRGRPWRWLGRRAPSGLPSDAEVAGALRYLNRRAPFRPRREAVG